MSPVATPPSRQLNAAKGRVGVQSQRPRSQEPWRPPSPTRTRAEALLGATDHLAVCTCSCLSVLTSPSSPPTAQIRDFYLRRQASLLSHPDFFLPQSSRENPNSAFHDEKAAFAVQNPFLSVSKLCGAKELVTKKSQAEDLLHPL